MKKLSLLLVFALLLSSCMLTVSAEGEFGESPMLADLVEAGELPPVENRLPEVPKVADELSAQYVDPEIGNYGGTLRTATSSVNWNAHIFMGSDENLLTQVDMTSGVITPNIVEAYTANEANTEFTFTLRKGLRWSDGTEVTMEDISFTVNDVLFNETLSPVIENTWRTGNSASGTPMVFEIMDDYTFKVTFDAPYGGFLAKMSTSASWAGYTNMMKPAYFLKPFHLDYAEECHGSLEAYYEYIAPFAEVLGYDDATAEDVWTYVFNQIDVTNWELTDPNDCLTSEFFPGLIDTNFPVLYAWMMESSDNNIQTYVRNPYYWKVDEDGNQLPYIDYVISSYVEDEETFALEVIAGNVDFTGVTNANYMSLYLENEDKGNYRYISATDPATFGAAHININYGLNTDGTVKDDDDSKAWQEMNGDIRFRQALMYAIDAEEVSEVVYSGLAVPNPDYTCNNDVDLANDLLNEMGAVDIDNDGYRETPSGLKFQWQIWTQAGNDHVTFAELYSEYWRAIGLNVSVYTTEESLLTASMQANEVPMRMFYCNGPSFWIFLDWDIDIWAPLYSAWFNAGGMSGELVNDGSYLEPTDEVKQIYTMVQSMMEVDADTAANEINPKIAKMVAENLYIIMPILNCPSAISYNNDLGNVPSGGTAVTHTMNFDMERLFFKNPEEH